MPELAVVYYTKESEAKIMQLAKLAVLARKIHRLMVLIIIPLGLTQITTGLRLKYPALIPFLKAETALSIHSLTGVWFAVFLLVMMVTGSYLYLYPTLQRIKQKTPRQE